MAQKRFSVARLRGGMRASQPKDCVPTLPSTEHVADTVGRCSAAIMRVMSAISPITAACSGWRWRKPSA